MLVDSASLLTGLITQHNFIATESAAQIGPVLHDTLSR
jgi:hypothetical protein